MKVYISNYLSRSISVIDYDTLEVEDEITLEENIYPNYFCIDKEKNLIYIPNSSSGMLYVLDLVSKKMVDTVSIGGSLTQIVLNVNELFVANEDTDSIYILDKNNLNPIGIIGVDSMPHGFDFDREVNKLYVPCISSIISIDTLQKSIYKKIELDFKAWHVKLDTQKKQVYVSTLDGRVVILDTNTMDIIKILDEFLLPIEMCFNYSQKKIYVTDLVCKNVKILDYVTGKYIESIYVEGSPQGLSISEDETLLFVSDIQKNSIKVYDTFTNNMIKEVYVGKEPTTIVCV
ncbi:MAG: YncE family protein [Romboutsia sp.]